MTTSTKRPRGHVVMVVAHRAMARDLEAAAAAAGTLATAHDPAGDPDTVAAREGVDQLVDYVRRVLELIEHHHVGEDQSLWPALSERGAPTEVLAELSAQHDEVHRALGDADAALRAVVSAPSPQTLVALDVALREAQVVLTRHTAAEEDALDTSLAPVLDESLWKHFEREMVRSAPRWTLTFMPAWLAGAATSDERGRLPARPIAALFGRSVERRRAIALRLPV